MLFPFWLYILQIQSSRSFLAFFCPLFILCLNSVGEYPRHLLQYLEKYAREENSSSLAMVPNGRSVTESLYFISPNSCFCIHAVGASPNSNMNCLLKADKDILQVDAISFTVLHFPQLFKTLFLKSCDRPIIV